MVRFKQLLGIPLYATVLWLGWVLALQSGLLASSSDWEKFSLEKVQRYERQGKPVFVDFTAAWCVTCQVNKQLVLSRPDVEQALLRSGMALLRADWTRRDEEITRALAALGQALRVQGNFIEYVPLALALMGLIEASGARPWIVYAYGAVLLVARFVHAWGLYADVFQGRVIGTSVTWILLAGGALGVLGLVA